jgi:NAD(P)-dependent dehydrogenase (short-subunit alcohol dehydrogenase family)
MATVVITGANRGIGRELARQFSQRGDHVVAACRSADGAFDNLDVEVVEGVDVTTDGGVAVLKDGLGDRRVDVLVNNAGVLSRESLDDLDFDRIRHQMEVNAYGPLRVTAVLSDLLGEGSKAVVITSRMGSIDDNTSGGRYGYRMSKAAVNMAFRSLSHDLRPKGVSVAILHPGFVRTDMTDHEGMVDPPESAAGLIARIDELTLDNTGTFWHANGEVLPW